MTTKKRRQPLPPDHPLSLPLPSHFPVLPPSKPRPAHTEMDDIIDRTFSQLPPAPAPYGEHGYVAALDSSGTCRACGESGCIERRPGRYPRCWKCGVIQLYMGRFYDAPCISGNGRTDCHGSYVRSPKGDFETDDVEGIRKDLPWLCAFCGRSMEEPLPEWPEIEEDDITVETGIEGGAFRAVQGPRRCWVRITHRYHPEISILADSEASLLKNKAIALKRVREALKRVGRGAYNPDEE